MGLIGVLIGALVGKGLDIFGSDFLFELLLGMFIAFFFMAAGNMLNDYFDREQDKVNHPDRPIPSGAIKPNQVIVSAAAIFIVLLILGILVYLIMFIILILATFLMLGYELLFKRRGLVGNFTIGLLVGMLFLFGAAVVSEFGVVIFLFTLALLATLTREIVKDIEDIKGDIDRITLPKQVGIKTSASIAAGFIIIAIVLSPFPALPEFFPLFSYDGLGLSYLVLIIPADLIFIFSIRHYEKKPKLAQNFLKLGMLVGLIAYTVGSII
jgi:geranylgeranylglycerol-phosphate geranylgeranyltransferase